MTRMRTIMPWSFVPGIFSDDFDIAIPQGVTFPPVDVYEDDKNLVVKVELSGFEPKDIDVSIDGDVLRISGKKEVKREDKNKKYYISEIHDRSFSRTISLPVEINQKDIKAEFENGVLTLTLPKVNKPKALKIPIKVVKK